MESHRLANQATEQDVKDMIRELTRLAIGNAQQSFKNTVGNIYHTYKVESVSTMIYNEVMFVTIVITINY